ncbi:MAG: flp pilus assembly protein secretin CpaC [Herminiimonas sp.]|nr:flp pilus assembly protein secretin CpaC [Herminiimonas sp.]
MLTRLLIICSWCFLAFSGVVHAQDKPAETRSGEIQLFVGEVKILPVDKIQRIAVGNGKLFSTSVLDNKELLLIAEAVGDSSLVIWSDKNRKTVYTVRISPRDAGDANRNVSALLKDIPGIQITPVGTNVIISGTASKENLQRIATAVRMYPQAASLVREEEVSMKKMVYMKVQIIEMKKSLLDNIGLQWPGSFDGPKVGFSGNFGTDRPQTQGPLKGILPVPNSGLLTYLGISSLISTTINIAKNNGDAYMLAEPELSARSGGEAKFLAGGQIPLPAISSLGGGSVEFKDYGVRLSIKPVADDQGNIMASVKTEISSIDSSVSVQGIPGFLTRQSETEVNVKNGETIVMSGLVNTDMSNDTTRVPGISNIPVLGRLFRSDNFKSGRTDLVILVTPTITDPASTINRERLEKSMDIRERFERKLSNQDIID